MSAVDKEKQRAAILKLLGDDDVVVAEMVIGQLLSRGGASLSEIDVLLAMAKGSARKYLLLAQKKAKALHLDFQLADRCGQIETLAELEDFCWKFAAWNDPQSDLKEAKIFIDSWGEVVKSRIQSDFSDLQKLEVLVSILSKEEGLTGNVKHYYDVENSFLDSVVFSRQGIPISLTAIYMFVGARAGIKVEGIGVPGHFLARLGSCYFDPYHEGSCLEQEQLDVILKQAPEELKESLLVSLSYRLIAQRMVSNVVSIYTRKGDEVEEERFCRVLKWLGGE